MISFQAGCNNGGGPDVSSFTGQGISPGADSVSNPIPSPIGAYSHDNNLTFQLQNFDYGSITMSFTETAHSITSGQPWNGVTYSNNGTNSFTIDVKCGRKGSGSPLQWMVDQLQGGPVIGADGSSWHPGGHLGSPGSLNFAVTGVLTIDGNRYTICLGQAGEAWHNVWYLGGPGFTEYLITPDGKYAFDESGSDDMFLLTKMSH
jgi:hypothetical protein